MDIQARGDFVILEPLDAPEKIGGIILTETKREMIRQRPLGRVLSVGPKVNDDLDANPIEVDDIVIFIDIDGWGVHGLDGDMRAWCKRDHIVGKLLRDVSATPEELKAKTARAERLMSERNAAATLVQATGAIPKLAK
jgi:hypothetical protein